MRRMTLIFALALLATACGAQELQEQISEEAIGGNADVEISGEGEDFSLSVESDDGSIQFGAGAELPGGLTVPVPDGGDVTTSFEDSSSAGASIMYPEDRYEDLVSFYDSWSSGIEGEWSMSTSTFDLDGETQRNSQWNTSNGQYFILVSDCIDIATSEFTAACVTVNENL
jgi:hypothetical protein